MRPSQTLVKTGTGIWAVTYNVLNRPICFTKSDGSVIVSAAYDYMGRRVSKQVVENGVTALHQRYLYRSYLQIAALDLTRPTMNALWFITWDPTEPVATRPLAIQKDGTWYSAPTRPAAPGSPSQECSGLGVWLLKPHPAYGLDLTKNVMEVYGSLGFIATAYTYTPFGKVTASGSTEQPLLWSSEYTDKEILLYCYNFRYYNSMYGKWISRDPIPVRDIANLYTQCLNSTTKTIDILGMTNTTVVISGGVATNGKADRNWLNFITPAIYILEREKNKGKKVAWLLEKSAYSKRKEKRISGTFTHCTHPVDPNDTGLYIQINNDVIIRYETSYRDLESEITEIAKSIGVTPERFENEEQIMNSLNKIAAEKGKICQLYYFGHGIIGAWWLQYGKRGLTANDFKKAEDAFAKHPIIYLETCHSASELYNDKGDGSFAQQLSTIIPGSLVQGYDGRVDYTPIGKGDSNMPWCGDTINSQAKSAKTDNRANTHVKHDVRRRNFRGGIEI